MSKSRNHVELIGNLGKDVVTNATNNNGGIAANITIATTESWKDKQTGNKVEKTEWHNVAAFGKLAEIMAQYLKKGSKVFIEGKLKTRKWQDENGNDRWTTEIVASEMIMLDPPVNKQGYQPNQNQKYGSQANNQNQTSANNGQNNNQNFQNQTSANNGHNNNQNFQNQAPANNGQNNNQNFQNQTPANNGQNNNQNFQHQAPANNGGFGAQEDDIPFQGINGSLSLMC